ncbi:MAG: class I SAM-dependent methyltransferase, partial [Rickettsiales bacterium]|nr:class I SAM-dependent methyltransferase [Rickettsiales bacterium]
SFVGYSTLWLARALPSHGQLITIEADDHHAQMAQGFFEQSECHSRITLLKGRALEQLPHLTNQRFDLVFIDAQKSEYLDYLQCVEPMIRVGGLIIGDNSLLFGAVHAEPQQRVSAAATHAMRAFNKHLSDTTFYDAILLPTSEGLTIARKK